MNVFQGLWGWNLDTSKVISARYISPCFVSMTCLLRTLPFDKFWFTLWLIVVWSLLQQSCESYQNSRPLGSSWSSALLQVLAVKCLPKGNWLTHLVDDCLGRVACAFRKNKAGSHRIWHFRHFLEPSRYGDISDADISAIYVPFVFIGNDSKENTNSTRYRTWICQQIQLF